MTMERGDVGSFEPKEAEKGPEKPEIKEVREKPKLARLKELLAGTLIVLSAAKAGEANVFAKAEAPKDDGFEKAEKYTAEFGGVAIRELQEHGLELAKIRTIIQDVRGQNLDVIAQEEVMQSVLAVCQALDISLYQSNVGVVETARYNVEQSKKATAGEEVKMPYILDVTVHITELSKQVNERMDRQEIRGVSKGVGVHYEPGRLVFGGGYRGRAHLGETEKRTRDESGEYLVRVTVKLVDQSGNEIKGMGEGEQITPQITEESSEDRGRFLGDGHEQRNRTSKKPDLAEQISKTTGVGLGELMYSGYEAPKK